MQVYNAAFSPDAQNYCENDNSSAPARTCNSIGGNYHLHEDDGGPFSYGTTQNYAAMRYSLEAGGKRLRPVLTLAAAELFGARADAIPAAVATGVPSLIQSRIIWVL